MGIYKTESNERLLASVDKLQEHIHVFVSHKSSDEAKAKEVATCINSYGLRTWLDVTDLTDDEDDDAMVDRIEAAIAKSFSLMAIVTDVTNESWWVPFEIGLAYDMKKELASYCEDQEEAEIPSFLSRWPLVDDHASLHIWCKHIKSKRMESRPVFLYEAAGSAGLALSKNAYQESLNTVKSELNRYRGGAR